MTSRLKVAPIKHAKGQLRKALAEATNEFTAMLARLPELLTDRAVVYEAHLALRDWMGDVTITPTKEGPEARWTLREAGLLVSAGPRVAELVAGAGFEPATFGL